MYAKVSQAFVCGRCGPVRARGHCVDLLFCEAVRGGEGRTVGAGYEVFYPLPSFSRAWRH